MGVKGLFQFLKRFEKEVYIPHILSDLTVGVDIFWFIHKSKGDLFTFQSNLLPIIKNSKKTICVFDGSPSEEKQKYIESQSYKRDELTQSIIEIEKFLRYPFNQTSKADKQYLREQLTQLKRQVWSPSPEYITTIKHWLVNKGCEVYQAQVEADNILVDLEVKGQIDAIITNDSDILILGSKKVIRPKTPFIAAVFDTDKISQTLGFTQQQWKDFMYLCKTMKENDIIMAYSLISVYKELENIYQKPQFKNLL